MLIRTDVNVFPMSILSNGSVTGVGVNQVCWCVCRCEVQSGKMDAALRSSFHAAVSFSQSGTAQPGLRDGASVALSRRAGPPTVTGTTSHHLPRRRHIQNPVPLPNGFFCGDTRPETKEEKKRSSFKSLSEVNEAILLIRLTQINKMFYFNKLLTY